MINRVLIRVKVVQVLYCYLLTRPDRSMDQALAELDKSFEKAYDLYLGLLMLPVAITNLQERRIDEAKNKFLPTAEDLTPNTRFIDNSLVEQIRQNADLQILCENRLIQWDDPIMLRLMLEKVLKSEIYAQYMAQPATDPASDAELWRQLLRQVILPDEDFLDYMENDSLYISAEDVDIMGQFALKTIKRIADGAEDPISPMFRDDDDNLFGRQLLEKTIRDYDDNNVLIDSCVYSERWDRSRVALMDRVVMNTAVTELKWFDQIPSQVTLNEYIELAKVFGSDGSGSFVNGVLDNVVNTLRQRGRLLK